MQLIKYSSAIIYSIGAVCNHRQLAPVTRQVCDKLVASYGGVKKRHLHHYDSLGLNMRCSAGELGSQADVSQVRVPVNCSGIITR